MEPHEKQRERDHPKISFRDEIDVARRKGDLVVGPINGESDLKQKDNDNCKQTSIYSTG